MLKVWIANLGKYNEGNLVGEWIDLEECGDFETAWDELKQAIGLDGERYEEWACFDAAESSTSARTARAGSGSASSRSASSVQMQT